MAVLVEVPIAILLGLRSRLLLTGGMPSRGLTLQDIEIHADASYQRLLRNLGTLGSCDAANHRDEFGSWGKGERAVTHLTVTELASFKAEYNELLIRYCLLHARPTAGTREVAIRFYAFHFPEHPINDVPDKTRIQPHPAH
ncbi:hypothetical protein [Pseudonocardia sp.]|uniref:hypothetical protein n=1 Tax=Pseudonocardia sp. TaxID=60912 RepID=UPI0031FBDB9B